MKEWYTDKQKGKERKGKERKGKVKKGKERKKCPALRYSCIAVS